jgi:hypothetical protein
VFFITLFLLSTGLGFSNYFNLGYTSSKLLPLGEFALGIEAAQIVCGIYCLDFFVHRSNLYFQRDWTLVMSAFIIGVVVPLIRK